jgi:hypothetical protein
MGKHTDNDPESPIRRGRSRALTVFAAALVAGGAAALGVNRLLELHLERVRPRVESEPIFVSLRSLPSGAAVTVWDVGLREWPKAMVPGAAIRSIDSFHGLVARHPLREGQPLLAVQLSFDPEAATREDTPATTLTSGPTASTGDLWLPAETAAAAPPARAATRPVQPSDTPAAPPTQAALPGPLPVVTVPLAPPTPITIPITTPATTAPPSSPTVAPVGATVTVTGSAPAIATVGSTSTDIDPLPTTGTSAASAAVGPIAHVPVETGTATGADCSSVPPAVPPPAPTTTASAAAPAAAGGGLRPLLPETWAPTTLRTIIVPQRIALKAEDDTAAAVAAAITSSSQRRGKAVVATASKPVTPAGAVEQPTSPAARIASAPVPSSPLRQPPSAQETPRSSAQGSRPASSPPRPRPQPAPSRGFRLPSFFDWSK